MLLPLFEDSDLEGKRRVEISPASLFNTQVISQRVGAQGFSIIQMFSHRI